MILTSTPYRVSLFGGGTDYPEWFSENSGATLGLTINHYCYIAVRPLPPLYNGINYRIVYSHVEDRASIQEIEHPAVNGILNYLGWDSPLEIVHMGDLPARSGLGSSSAFTVGLLHALHTLQGRVRFKPDLANEAIFVERKVLKETVGYQDQILTAMGGLNFIRFPNERTWKIEQLLLASRRLEELERSLVLVYTGKTRNAHEMAAQQIAEQKSNHGATVEGAFCTPRFALRLMEQQAFEARKLLLDDTKPLAVLGPMLHEMWSLKRGLSEGLTLPEVDELYQRGLDCGATGGKLLGAGGGGFILFFVPPERSQLFKAQVGAPCIPVKISMLGTHKVITPQ